MSNGHACCILGICCPPLAQKNALAEVIEGAVEGIAGDDSLSATQRDFNIAHRAAEALLLRFDLAPKGTAQAVIDGWGAGAELRAAAIGERVVALYAATGDRPLLLDKA